MILCVVLVWSLRENMKVKLYEPFQKWYHDGTIWLIGDLHFQKDTEMEKAFGWPSAEERLAILNKYVTKNDTFICLGDVGDRLDLVAKIKAGYKVLIKGNHDKGDANYKRRIMECGVCYSEQEAKDIIRKGSIHTFSIGNVKPDSYERRVCINGNEMFVFKTDNRLFDEVYEGPLFISDKILLSHERFTVPFAVNIHGHHHCEESWMDLILTPTIIGDVTSAAFNLASDVVEYTPMRLDKLIEKYPLKKIKSMHDITIENARRDSE